MSKKTTDDSSKVLQEIISRALSQLMSGGELPKERSTVLDCAVHVIFEALDCYMRGNSKMAIELDALFAAFSDSDDEIVQGMGALNRQAVWGVLNMLRREKERRHGNQIKAGSESGSASEGSASAPSGEGGTGVV